MVGALAKNLEKNKCLKQFSAASRFASYMYTAFAQELFEETGLLLGSSVQSAATSRELEEIQEKTKTDVESFKLACPSPPVDQLLEWNTWLTPSSYKQRYMTSFYIIRIEGEPQIRMCEKEMVHYSWMAPKDCLERAAKGEVVLPPPQVYELTRISQTPCEELHKHCNSNYVLCPQHIGWQNQPFITNALPGDHLYIDDDSYHQPPRTMSLEAVKVDLQKSTHRVEYCSKPLYTKCKVYMHNLPAKYRNSFHQFETSSKKLQQ